MKGAECIKHSLINGQAPDNMKKKDKEEVRKEKTWYELW